MVDGSLETVVAAEGLEMHEELLIGLLPSHRSLLVAFHSQPHSFPAPPPPLAHDLALDLLLSPLSAREFSPFDEFSLLDLFFLLECRLNFLK